MNALFKFVITTFFAIALISPATASDRGTKREAVALVQNAIAYYKANGREKTLAEINGKFAQVIDRDMYVYVFNTEVVMLANGVVERMVGKQTGQIKDADGKSFGEELQKILRSGKPGWVDYKWPKPVTKQIESKTAYAEPVGDLGAAVGFYKP